MMYPATRSGWLLLVQNLYAAGIRNSQVDP